MNSAEREFAFQLLLSEALALSSSLLFYRLHKKINRGWTRVSKPMILQRIWLYFLPLKCIACIVPLDSSAAFKAMSQLLWSFGLDCLLTSGMHVHEEGWLWQEGRKFVFFVYHGKRVFQLSCVDYLNPCTVLRGALLPRLIDDRPDIQRVK